MLEKIAEQLHKIAKLVESEKKLERGEIPETLARFKEFIEKEVPSYELKRTSRRETGVDKIEFKSEQEIPQTIQVQLFSTKIVKVYLIHPRALSEEDLRRIKAPSGRLEVRELILKEKSGDIEKRMYDIFRIFKENKEKFEGKWKITDPTLFRGEEPTSTKEEAIEARKQRRRRPRQLADAWGKPMDENILITFELKKKKSVFPFF